MSQCVYELFCMLLLSDPLCTRYMEFVCKNRAQCLFHSLVCDGIKHCEDGSDEDAEYAGCGKEHHHLMAVLYFKKPSVHYICFYALIPVFNTDSTIPLNLLKKGILKQVRSQIQHDLMS